MLLVQLSISINGNVKYARRFILKGTKLDYVKLNTKE